MYPCNKCIVCRSRKRNQWATRMECESIYAKSAYFITLTSDDDNMFLYHGIPSLNKADLQNFIKRLRHRLPCKMRHFSVGEYGRLTGRPHYHLCVWLDKYIDRSTVASAVVDSWSAGFSKTCKMEGGHCYYIAKYCLKDGQTPFGASEPFQLCSKDPPIGYRFFEGNSDIFYKDFDRNYITSPSLKRAQLPRSFEKRIKDKLSNTPRSSFTDPAWVRSQRLLARGSLRLKQYLKDFNSLKPGEFVRMRDTIERRLLEKLHKSSKF